MFIELKDTMKRFLPRSATLLSTILFVSTSCPSLPLSRVQLTHAQEEGRQIEELDRVLRIGSDEEKRRAIGQLSEITNEEASELLLKSLKNNLANKRGNDVRHGSVHEIGLHWTSSPSQNELLVKALGNRKYKKALPTLRKMLEMNEKWLGFSRETVAANIYLISPRPVKYTVEGELKIYPEPPPGANVSSFTNSLSVPSGGEAAWEENSLNKRIRELVLFLRNPGGPEGVRDPVYKRLKEDIGAATLISLVKGDDLLIRPYAAEALGILGENSNEIIPLLTAAVRDKDPRMRFRSVRALGPLLVSDVKPEELAMIISAFKSALGDAEPEVRFAASETLGTYAAGRYQSMHGRTKDLVPLLVSALADKADYIRSGAASTLGRLGPLTEQVVSSLIRLLNSPERNDRLAAANALSELASHNNSYGRSGERERMGKEIGRALLGAAGDPSREVRYEVAEGLGVIGPVERGVIPALNKLTRDPSRGVRTAAAGSLGKFEIGRARIVPALARMLKVPDEEAEVIESALRSLGEMGREARSAAPEVRRLLQSENPRIREYAGYALEKIERPPDREGKSSSCAGKIRGAASRCCRMLTVRCTASLSQRSRCSKMRRAPHAAPNNGMHPAPFHAASHRR